MEKFIAFKKDAEIFKWGPIPGRFYYVSEFEDAVFIEFEKKYSGGKWPNTLFLFRNKQMVWINDFEELRREGKSLFLKYMLDSSTRNTLKAEWRNEVKNLVNFETKITKEFLESLDALEFYNLFYRFFELIVNFWLPTIPAELGNYGSDGLLKDELKKYIKDDAELSIAMEILTAPEKSSFYQEEEIDLANAKNLNDHLSKYFWLKNSYNGTEELSLKFFDERKKELSVDIEDKVNEKFAETKAKKAELIAKYSLPREIENISEAICDGVAWQDERKKYIFIYTHYKEVFLNEVAKRAGLPIESLRNYGTKEILDTIKDGNFKKPQLDRSDSFGFYTSPEIKELTSEEFELCWNLYVNSEFDLDAKELKGIIASAGKENVIKGRVKIVFNPNECEDFEVGDILVASMTSPEFVFLMKKSKAVITDNGGLTSHAAIVSRELGVACIVGTKVATRILHNGDLVEIDTKNGIVKIL